MKRKRKTNDSNAIKEKSSRSVGKHKKSKHKHKSVRKRKEEEHAERAAVFRTQECASGSARGCTPERRDCVEATQREPPSA
eukprot:2081081-Rhodomonas_salina.1